MSKYGQFCPIAKAAEVLGERWTLLIVRELLLGSTRFNELQRALSHMSPSLLTKRLEELQQADLIVKQKTRGQIFATYHLTPEGRQLSPVIEALAAWGMRSVRAGIDRSDLDAEFLMWDIRRRIDTEQLPSKHCVLGFHFSDQKRLRDWWLVVDDADVDLCTREPGRDADLHVVAELRTLVDVWMGNLSISAARNSQKLKLIGSSAVGRHFNKWFTLSAMALR
jgi:DNA-binding HxlR family transcriptional regulator